MRLLTGETVLRDQTPGYERQLQPQLINLSLKLQDAVVGLPAVRTTSDAINRGPDDVLDSSHSAVADRVSILQFLFDTLADHSAKS
jgi:hypothetical protein